MHTAMVLGNQLTDPNSPKHSNLLFTLLLLLIGPSGLFKNLEVIRGKTLSRVSMVVSRNHLNRNHAGVGVKSNFWFGRGLGRGLPRSGLCWLRRTHCSQ